MHHVSISLFVFKFYYFFLIFTMLFPFSLIWGHIVHMGIQFPNDISSESTQQIRCPKVMDTPMEAFYQSCSNNCDISKFEFSRVFLSFFFFFIFVMVSHGSYGRKSFKQHRLWKYRTDSLLQIHVILLGRVYTKVVKILNVFAIFCSSFRRLAC